MLLVAFLAILGLGGWRCDALGRSADDDSSIYLLVALAAVATRLTSTERFC